MIYLAWAVILRDDDWSKAERLRPGKAVSATLSVRVRVRVMMLPADGFPSFEIGKRTGLTRPTVLKWRGRYSESEIEGLKQRGPAGTGAGAR